MQFKTTANFVCVLYQHCVSKPAIFLASRYPLLRIQDHSNIMQFHFSDCSVFTQNKLQSRLVQQLQVASTGLPEYYFSKVYT